MSVAPISSRLKTYQFSDPQPYGISSSLAGRNIQIDVSQCRGEGITSKVFFANNPETNSPLAVKVITYAEVLQCVKRESEALAQLKDAPYTVKIRGVVEDSSGHRGIAMARCKGEQLFKIIGRKHLFLVDDVLLIAQQAFEALQYYQSQKIIHGDVKLENCFYDLQTKQFMFLDFGMAHLVPTDQWSGAWGVTAPEIRLDEVMTYGADIWSLGTVLFATYARGSLFPDRPTILQEYAQQFGGVFLERLGQGSIERGKLEVQKFSAERSEEGTWWFNMPWRDRIYLAAKEKKEPRLVADRLVLLLEKIFVEYESRTTAEEGLKFLAEMKTVGCTSTCSI